MNGELQCQWSVVGCRRSKTVKKRLPERRFEMKKFLSFLIPTFNKIIYSNETLKTLFQIAKNSCNNETFFFFAYFNVS